MDWGKLISTIILGGTVSCHAPVLLTELNPESKPLNKFKYFNAEFRLPENSPLKTNGFYYNIGTPRKVPITVKSFNEAKKNGIAPAGFEFGELNITKDTVLTVVNTNVYVFYPNGSFSLRIYNNKLIDEIEKDATVVFQKKNQGSYVYKLEGDIIKYETYSKMSGFYYTEGTVGENFITVGKSEPYQFIAFN